MTITKPTAGSLTPYAQYYIDKVNQQDLIEALSDSRSALVDWMSALSEEQGDYRYAPGKWTVKEVVRHMVDVERILCYRAFRFSRKDATALPGFEENDYIRHTEHLALPWKVIITEYSAVRASSLSLYEAMSMDMLDFPGLANNTPYSARILGFMTVGHQLHHAQILHDRYGL